ncbi:four helix bundle protein [Fontivita pretiosa]|uniref:four helix bundle protein n=1 Tax=Fontivita pretiosa TaxID=2989684 RepID=UPI003D17A20F
MTEADMIRRTKRFALRVLKLIDVLPDSCAGRVIAAQLGRCATSVGANYRAACRGRSKAEFYSKLGIVEEEADESLYWLELIMEAELIKPARIRPLYLEAEEILAIIVASRRTTAQSLAAERANRKSQIANRKS